nr:NAD(P)H-dependent glycerol-3-phosphate dehydrogenase [Actinomycetota bacterium]
MTRVSVIGAGSWGTAVAAIACGNADTVLWARRPELAEAMRDRHENPDYLPG